MNIVFLVLILDYSALEHTHKPHKSRLASIRNLLTMLSRWNFRYRVKIAKGSYLKSRVCQWSGEKKRRWRDTTQRHCYVHTSIYIYIYIYINPDRDSHPPALCARSARHWMALGASRASDSIRNSLRENNLTHLVSLAIHSSHPPHPYKNNCPKH